jgi:hypothetical protein
VAQTATPSAEPAVSSAFRREGSVVSWGGRVHEPR